MEWTITGWIAGTVCWLYWHLFWTFTGANVYLKDMYLFRDKWYISCVIYIFDALGIWSLIMAFSL